MPNGILKTNVKSFDVDIKPNLRNLIYSLNGGSIRIIIYASPGQNREEVKELILNEENSQYDVIWNRKHKRFQIETELIPGLSSGSVDSPLVDQLGLGLDNVDNKIAWSTNDDWSASLSDDGVVYEDTENTEHNNENTIKRGYKVESIDSQPYMYHPMHQDITGWSESFGELDRRGYIDGSVFSGREGLLDTTSFKFEQGYIDIQKNLLYDFSTGDFSNWDNINTMSISTDEVYSGSYSALCNGSTTSNEGSTVVFPGGKTPKNIEFTWKESTNNNGGGLSIINSNGNLEFSMVTDGTEWEYVSNSGVNTVLDPSVTDQWTKFSARMNWEDDRLVLDYESLESDTSKTEKGLFLRQGVDMEKIAVIDYNDGSITPGSQIEMWIDNILIE